MARVKVHTGEAAIGFTWGAELQGIWRGWGEKLGSWEKMVPEQTLQGLVCLLQELGVLLRLGP